VPSTTIGVVAKTPDGPLPSSLKRHLTLSFETVDESIGVFVVARVLARS
jgi:hypothetical protein